MKKFKGYFAGYVSEKEALKIKKKYHTWLKKGISGKKYWQKIGKDKWKKKYFATNLEIRKMIPPAISTTGKKIYEFEVIQRNFAGVGFPYEQIVELDKFKTKTQALNFAKRYMLKKVI
jgi:hypothetical protein